MRSVIGLLVMLALVAGCGDSSDSEPVVFGEGEIPAAVPDDFPIPADAVIGSTLVDNVNSRSEFEFRVPVDMDLLVRSLSTQLVERGYVIDSSSGDELGWSLTFRRGRLEGGAQLRPLGPGVSQGVVTVNDT